VIERLLDLARARAEAADGIERRVERTGLEFESGRLKSAAVTEETGIGLRVVRQGRVGIAGSTAGDLPALLERALASSELGESVPLAFPGHTTVPAVVTHDQTAAAAQLSQLVAIGQELVQRLSRDGCQVNVSVERATGATTVANSAGTRVTYAETGVALGADIRRIAGDDVLMIYDQWAATHLPAAADLNALVDSIASRLDHALTVVPSPEGSLPVVFTPSGLAAIVLPLEQALSGKAVLQGISPLGGRVGERVFDAAVSLVDDPLIAGRPQSRPVDDEGVASRRLPLVEDGVVRGFIYDLETAARAGAAPTGHGRRSIFGKPRADFSNLVVGPLGANHSPLPTPRGADGVGRGSLGGGLISAIKDGLLVDDLIGVGQGNVIGGAFSHPVALAYRVQNGAITGRVKNAAVAGNVYDLLKKVGGWGSDGRWIGSRWSASLLLEGVSVAG
jgi:PmbA protein